MDWMTSTERRVKSAVQLRPIYPPSHQVPTAIFQTRTEDALKRKPLGLYLGSRLAGGTPRPRSADGRYP